MLESKSLELTDDPYISPFDGGDPRFFALVDDEGEVIPGSAVGILRCGVCSSAVFDLEEHKKWHAQLAQSAE